MKASTGFLLCLALGLGACAQRQEGPPTFGEAMEERGNMTREVADKWQRGNEKVQRGSRMIEESKQDAAEGQRLVREGRSEMREAEAEARSVRQQPLPPGSTQPTSPASSAPSGTAPAPQY